MAERRKMLEAGGVGNEKSGHIANLGREALERNLRTLSGRLVFGVNAIAL